MTHDTEEGRFAEWLTALRRLDGSDLLLVAGSRPMIRGPAMRPSPWARPFC